MASLGMVKIVAIVWGWMKDLHKIIEFSAGSKKEIVVTVKAAKY